MPRSFYLISHNPNTVDDAVNELKAGANALEPDVYFADNNFYVMEMVPLWSKLFPPKKGPLLADYLTGLQKKITDSLTTPTPLHVALLLLDTKNLDQYDVNTLMEVVRTNFTLANVQLIITTGNKKYLPRFTNFTPKNNNEAVGIDGGCNAADADKYFKPANIRYTYANGTSLPLIATTAPTYLNQVRAAIQLRDGSNPSLPIIVYAWTVNSKSSMRAYIRLGVDGFITDKMKDAMSVIAEDEFKGKIERA